MELILEACVDDEAQAMRAQAQGAGRIELCSRLDLDGLTPSDAFIRFARAALHIPVHVMIRPRGGDFVYSEEELEAMCAEIAFCKAAGVPGVVFGVLTPDHRLDIPAIVRLADLARPMKVVVHKAIDLTPDPVAAVAALRSAKAADYVLSSGGAPTAQLGADTLRQMIAAGGASVTVIAAGKITDGNLQEMHRLIGAKEYHGRLIVGPLM
ncbi:MAG: copper homeostasis protein CutC [Saprospiraceae bacterium]|jgi:copper homeostasis protein